jgi:Tol biopolymer transport system component
MIAPSSKLMPLDYPRRDSRSQETSMPSTLTLPRFRSRRTLLARLLGAGLGLALTACDGADEPLAPAGEPAAASPVAEEVAGSASTLAASLVGSKVAYDSRVNGQSNIWLMNGDGTGRKQFTSFSGDEHEPAWSRDNRHLAFIRRRADATNTLHWDVFLMDADGTHKHWARSTPSGFDIMSPSWSADGKRLVVAVTFDGIDSYLATMELGTDKMEFVSDNTPKIMTGGSPSYSPSGESIVYVGDDGESICEVYPNGDPYILVVGPGPVTKPAWSPDGKKIAYGRVVGNNMDLYVMTRATMAVKRLTFNAMWDGDPTWSKDGSTILFESNRTGQSQIWSMPAAGGTQTRIAKTSTWDESPAFTF